MLESATTAIDFQPLSELEPLAARNPALEFRLSGYRYLVEQLHFNTFPDGAGANSIEIDPRRGLLHIAEIFEQGTRLQPLPDTVASSGMQIERELLYKLPGTSRIFRGLLRFGSGREHLEAWLKGGPLGFLDKAEEWNAAPRLLAFAYLIAADLCACGRQNEQARCWLDRAQTTYAEASDPAGIAICRMFQGDRFCTPFSTPEVWNHAIQEGASSSNLDHAIEAAEFDRSEMQPELARAAYVEAEQAFGQAGALRGLAAVQLRYGYLAMLDGDYDRAAQHALAAKVHFETTGDHLGAHLACAHHALSRVGGGHLPVDTATARAIGEWGRNTGSFSYSIGLGLLCAREGRRWLIAEGEYERALACFRLAEVLFDALGAPASAARTLVDQATTFLELGEVAAALEQFEKASDLQKRVLAEWPVHAHSVWVHAIMLGQLIFRLYISQTDPEGMERAVARLYDLLSQAPTPPDPNAPLDDLTASANASAFAGAETENVAMRRQMAATMVQTTLQQAYALIPDYHGLRAREAGDKERARQGFEEALARAAQIRTQDTTLAEISALAHLERWEEAAALNRQRVEAEMQSLARGLESSPVGAENSMFLLLKQQSLKQAFTSFAKLRAYQDALFYLGETEQLLGKDWWKHHEKPWEPLSDYGEVYEGVGQWDRAQAYYDQAIALLDERRGRLTRDELKTALGAVSSVQWLYFQAARTAAKRYQAALAAGDPAATEHLGKVLEYAERGKARALLDLVAADAVLAGSTPTESQALRNWRKVTTQLTLWRGLLAQERNKSGLEKPDQRRIEDLKDKIIASEAKLRQAEADLAQAAPNFYRTVNPRAAVISLHELIARLPSGTALLQYYFLGKHLLSWAITHEGANRLYMEEADTWALSRQIRDFHHSCSQPGGTVDEELGSALAQRLLAPFAQEIRDHAHLIIVPYAAAHTLPFHALPWESQPLAATHIVSYLPSSSTLQYLRREQAVQLPDRILAVGNPAGMAYKPPLGGEAVEQTPLPAAEIETAAVAGLFGDSLLLLNEMATESTVREHITDYPLLHFATHGHLSKEAPLLSSILLANGGGLTVYELMGLKLNAHLVVLSACETARGETTGGDDVIGLTRGLLAAGARAAVVSLWPVDDLSTSLFMGHFYGRLRSGDAPAVALQVAQKFLRELTSERAAEEFEALKLAIRGSGVREQAHHLLAEAQTTARHSAARRAPVKSPTSDYSNPYYWAPFILVG